MRATVLRLNLHALALLAVLGLAARPAMATVARLASDAELIRSSRLIVQGQIRSMISQQNADNIYTYAEVDVERVFKGKVRNRRIVVKQLGGTVGDITVGIDGSPSFRTGERVLLFLDTWPDGALRIAHLFMGKYDVIRDPTSGKTRVERKIDGKTTVLLRRPDAEESTQTADLPVFQEKIASLVRRQAESPLDPREEKVVEVPSEYRPAPENGKGALQSTTGKFVLLLDGNVYRRWFEPDSGQGVGFWFNLTQAPNGNAHTSLMNGMNAWTNVETSRIMLDFSGYTNAGGFYPDFLSTISFEDPRGQLQDPGPGCGGIVAGSAYVRRSNEYRVVNRVGFYRILESDIVFNNGWGPGACPLFVDDPSTRIIEEVAAHELGHSIGLGHSDAWDPAMRATVYNNGRGAWLSIDDVSGVTFIYPEPGNPIDNPRYYAGWHYPDWLNRGPDAGGWNDWTNYLTQCGGDTACMAFRRKDLPLGFIHSFEFQQKDPRFNGANYGTPAYNQAFVEECYLRYWKRPMDSTYWVSYLNSQGSQINNEHYRTVIEAFITSNEYRSRFDPYLCNPHDEEVCYSQGPEWSWNPFTCTCSYTQSDPCSDPFNPRCV